MNVGEKRMEDRDKYTVREDSKKHSALKIESLRSTILQVCRIVSVRHTTIRET